MKEIYRSLFPKILSRREVDKRKKEDVKRVVTLVSEGEITSYITGDEMEKQRQELRLDIPGRRRYRSKKYIEERRKRVISFLEQFK